MAISVADMRSTPEGYFTVRWGQPEYTDWIDESMSWKETCYIGDWSFLWERRFRGPDVLKLFSDVSVNSFANFPVRQSKHVIHCNDAGKIIHEGILSHLGDEEFMLFGRGGFWVDYKLRQGRYRAMSEPDDWFNFQVSGPSALYVVEKAAGKSIRDIAFMYSGKSVSRAMRLSRCDREWPAKSGTSYRDRPNTRAPCMRLFSRPGKEFGIRRLGGRAAFINPLEACFPTIVTDYLPAIFEEDLAEYLTEFKAAMPAYAATFNVAGSFDADDISAWYRSPVELGWKNRVRLDHDFIGRHALEQELARPRRVIRTLVWNPEDVIDVYASLYRAGKPFHYMEIPRDQRGFMYADKVTRRGRPVGVATSRATATTFARCYRFVLST